MAHTDATAVWQSKQVLIYKVFWLPELECMLIIVPWALDRGNMVFERAAIILCLLLF